MPCDGQPPDPFGSGSPAWLRAGPSREAIQAAWPSRDSHTLKPRWWCGRMPKNRWTRRSN